jgi:uncharacterized membrane protein YbhN (UPF0104 family)
VATGLTPEVIDRVTKRIDLAIRRNSRLEWLFIFILGTLFLVGLGLLIGGAITQHWEYLGPGSIVELAILYPIEQAKKLRQDNLLFETFPAMLEMANKTRSQELLAQFLRHLIERA